MTKFFLFAIEILLFTNIAFGCSYVKLPVSDNPIFFQGKLFRPAPKPAQYVFIGEVVEITKVAKPESDENRTDAEGLKIKVVENIYSPKSVSYYEVLPLTMYPDCSLQGITNLSKTFPIGSKVRVIAQEATIYKKPAAKDSIIRLEASYKNDGSVIRNDLDENIKTSAGSIFDYSSFTMKKPTTPDEERLFSLKFNLLYFELQKDLARLAKAKSEGERLKVMERLVYYPEIFNLAYHTLAQAYLKDSEKRRALEAKWEERIQQQIQQNKKAASK